jgi:ubiquinone/menaquinone biosynthesis C-methylase UbiE
MNTVLIAKFFMRRFQNNPVFDSEKIGTLQEVFAHPEYVNGSDEQQKAIKLQSSQSKYDDELNFPIDNYFGFGLSGLLNGKKVLDLGCLNGGRAIAWVESYQLKHLYGVDINPIYIEAATQFAKLKQVNADFKVGFGEALPFGDGEFDAILTYDVFEHVQSLEKTMSECYRVLKPGGILLAIFPSYYHPKEHHLSLVTSFPGLQYFFSGKTLVKAYYEIIRERGEEASWYQRSSPQLKDYEKCNTINGTTIRKFRKIIKQRSWRVKFQSRKPIGSVGRIIQKYKWLKIFSVILIPLTRVPHLQDFVLQRITFILQKPE